MEVGAPMSEQGEKAMVCPSCQAIDNNPYTDANGVAMRACGRCMIQWRDPSAPPAPANSLVLKDDIRATFICRFGCRRSDAKECLAARKDANFDLGNEVCDCKCHAIWGALPSKMPANSPADPELEALAIDLAERIAQGVHPGGNSEIAWKIIKLLADRRKAALAADPPFAL